MANKRKKRKKLNHKPLKIILAVCLVLVGTVLYYTNGDILNSIPVVGDVMRTPQTTAAQTSGEQMQMHVLNTGNSDCILLTSGSHAIMIDAGTYNESQNILRYLESQGIGRLDLVIATHPHADHIGGMAAVLNKIPCDQIMMPKLTSGTEPTSKSYESLLTAILENDIPAATPHKGDTYHIGDITLNILTPVLSDYGDNLNNASIVAMASCGDVDILLTGDAEKEVESALIADSAALDAEILKVGHHGSKTSSTEAFIEAVTPDYAVICVATDNSYGHPHENTISHLLERNVNIYQTNLHGTVVFTIDKNNVSVKTEAS